MQSGGLDAQCHGGNDVLMDNSKIYAVCVLI